MGFWNNRPPEVFRPSEVVEIAQALPVLLGVVTGLYYELEKKLPPDSSVLAKRRGAFNQLCLLGANISPNTSLSLLKKLRGKLEAEEALLRSLLRQ